MIRNFTVACVCILCSAFIPALAQVVYIPDSNFKNYLLSQPSINKNGDGEIQVTEARQVTALNVSGKSIADLTGIQEFTALTELQCNHNKLTSLDVQGIRWLRLLYITDNRLTSLNISTNTALQYLDVRRNQLSTLDFGTNASLYKVNCESNLLSTLNVGAQLNLAELICSHNDLSSLNLASNSKLTTLIAAHNSLQSVSVSGNPLLSTLHVYNNAITTLDLSNNPKLSALKCNHNQLSQLDLKSNGSLTDLRCYANQLTSLEFGTHPNLTNLMAFQNQLTSLTVNGLPALRTIQIQFNKITALDFKENHSLTMLDLRKNLLRTLDLRNGNNRAITSFDVTFNPPLTCIAVDDPEWSITHWPRHDYSAEYELSCGECDGIVYIPDPNFRHALVTNYEINTNMDGVIQYCEAEKYTGIIRVDQLNIQDMTGIEAFPHISYLNCMGNQISRLILGTKDNLGALDCPNNPMHTLDVSAAPSLNAIVAYSTQLDGIDVSNNPNLVNLDLHFVNIFSLDVSNNPKLRMLDIYADPITSLDLSANTQLTDLNINSTGIREIDLTHNPELGVLYANSLGLVEINLEANTKLYDVDLRGNEIPYLDFSHHPRMERLLAGENTSLTKMNMKGVNILDFGEFSTKMADNLVCIEVDNVEDAERVWRDDVEPVTSFSTDCSSVPSQTVYIPDPAFKAALVGNPNINTNGDGAIQFTEAEAYTGSIEVPGRNIADLTGVEAFININQVMAYNNQIEGELDLQKNTKLAYIDITQNLITGINVTGLDSLKTLVANKNRILAIDVSTNSNLDGLACNENRLFSVDVSSNHVLTWLSCSANQLKIIRMVPSLKYLEMGNNQVEKMDLTEAPNIEVINLNNNKLVWIKIEVLTKLFNAEMAGNQFTDLDFSNSPRLEVLNVRNNRLVTLNMNNIDVANFNSFAAQNNPNLHCIQVDDPEMAQRTMGYGIDSHMRFSRDCGYDEVVFIPDPALKAELIRYSDLDRNADGEIQYTEARNFNIPLFLINKGIKDMTGIEAFISLPELNVNVNGITSLDVRNLSMLTELHCAVNMIETLLLGSHPDMRELNAYDNKLTTLNTSGLIHLNELNVNHNRLTSVQFASNQPCSVDLSYNELASFNVSRTTVTSLKIDHNKLTSITMVAGIMSTLDCSDNMLTSLDVSHMHSMHTANVSNNRFSSLDVSTSAMRNFVGTANPDLGCIEVYDVGYAEANWRDDVDPGVVFSLECGSSPSARLSAWPNPSTGTFNLDGGREVGAVQIMDVSGAVKAETFGRQVDITALQPGIYYIKAQQGEKVSVVRVIKE
jgi:trimeric autotransporter adhesin